MARQQPCPIEWRPVSYESRLQSRRPEHIDLVVLHCTELPTLDDAREFAERIHYPESGTGNSGHYYIDRDGGIQQWVGLDRIAHHVRNHNANSIGIELVNRGRYPEWWATQADMTEPYPAAQIDALVDLLVHLQAGLPQLSTVTGHEDLDRTRIPATDDPTQEVARKLDPGPLFPWERLLAEVDLHRQRSR